MILFVFKLCLTAFILAFLTLGLDKILEPEHNWEEQEEKVLKVRKALDYIFIYTFTAGIVLGLIWLLMLVWFV